jgi:transposase
MSMRKRANEKQPDLWIPTSELAKSPGHPFYVRLNKILSESKFDGFVEERCARFYAEGKGRPSIPPGTYMRMLLVGFFEGLDSERGIAWRCADSMSLRTFLGYDLSESTPDHSSLSRIRQRLDVEVHQEVFTFVLKVLAEQGLLRGRTIGIDATTLEANAAMRSIVRRDDGTSYADFLVSLAKQSGIETPTRTHLARIDKKRPKKGSNDDWTNPHDPDAKITKMKDGRTHLAHKAEHAIDLDSGAVMAVTVQDATLGDCTTMRETMGATASNVIAVNRDPECAKELDPRALTEWVADKGYHSNDTMEMVAALALKSYVSEPERGQRRWNGRALVRDATYANRRRLKTKRGRALMRKRGELLERGFAHCLETGGMRRVHLRGRLNILKRYLVHVAAFNLSLVMRKIFGVGTPRGLQGRLAALAAFFRSMIGLIVAAIDSVVLADQQTCEPRRIIRAAGPIAVRTPSSTGC